METLRDLILLVVCIASIIIMVVSVSRWMIELYLNDEAEDLCQPLAVDLIIQYNLHPQFAEERYTCANCDQSNSCEFAHESFNIDGACLASALISK